MPCSSRILLQPEQMGRSSRRTLFSLRSFSFSARAWYSSGVNPLSLSMEGVMKTIYRLSASATQMASTRLSAMRRYRPSSSATLASKALPDLFST